MTVKLVGSTSGSVSLQAPASTTGGAHRVLTLPDVNGTVATTTTAGKILQVVSVSDSVRETSGSISLVSTGTYYATPFAVTITPSATSSKILLSGHVFGEATVNDYLLVWSIERAISGGATTDILAPAASNRPRCISTMPQGIYVSEQASTPSAIVFSGLLDSPNTTSAITYTFQLAAPQNSSVGFYYNRSVNDSDAADNERGLSWITAQEIAA